MRIDRRRDLSYCASQIGRCCRFLWCVDNERLIYASSRLHHARLDWHSTTRDENDPSRNCNYWDLVRCHQTWHHQSELDHNLPDRWTWDAYQRDGRSCLPFEHPTTCSWKDPERKEDTRTVRMSRKKTRSPFDTVERNFLSTMNGRWRWFHRDPRWRSVRDGFLHPEKARASSPVDAELWISMTSIQLWSAMTWEMSMYSDPNDLQREETAEVRLQVSRLNAYRWTKIRQIHEDSPMEISSSRFHLDWTNDRWASTDRHNSTEIEIVGSTTDRSSVNNLEILSIGSQRTTLTDGVAYDDGLAKWLDEGKPAVG